MVPKSGCLRQYMISSVIQDFSVAVARVLTPGYLSQYMISSVLQDFPFAKPVRKLHMQLTFRDKGCYWIRVGHCVVHFVWTFLYALVQLGQRRVRAMSSKRFMSLHQT